MEGNDKIDELELRKNETLLQEMVGLLEKAEKAPSAGSGNKAEVVHRGDAEVPVPILSQRESEAGYVYIYDPKTGEQSRANKNMVLALLKATNPDGTRLFTTIKPAFEPLKGTHKCFLHPAGPERKRYTEMGLPVCNKSNITNPYMVKKHMMNRHPTAWKFLEEERIEKERVDEIALRTAILQQMVEAKASAQVFRCEVCAKEFSTSVALTGHKNSHKTK
uniref:C2H2-type domain-containing protein n=1 Tax=viral metagenome TaxID=1070528 RepID=A0A6M3IPT0_9ZZZZ